MRRLLYALLGLVVTAGLAWSTVTEFAPGFALQDGSKLNQLSWAINGTHGMTMGSITVTGITNTGGSSTTGAMTITSASANALAVGRLGATTPAFNVDASAATSITGLNVVAAATGAGVSLAALGGTNEPLFLAGKGTGAVDIGGTDTTLAGLQVAQTASRVNGLNVVPGATGASVILNASTAGADTNTGIAITPKGTGIVKVGGTVATCSGTTTATCQGQRFIASITGLSTAPVGVESAAMTVTNASVVSSASIVLCSVNIYAGTGIPIATRITPGTGAVSFTITNVAGSGSLNATVPVACFVVGS